MKSTARLATMQGGRRSGTFRGNHGLAMTSRGTFGGTFFGGAKSGWSHASSDIGSIESASDRGGGGGGGGSGGAGSTGMATGEVVSIISRSAAVAKSGAAA